MIDFRAKKRIKAYFSSGKPTLILKLYLPTARFENDGFNSRFNAFYEALLDAYIREGEKYSKQCENNTRPATFTVECMEKTSPVGAVSVIRSFKLTLPTGEVKRGECTDNFELETGLLLKEKRKSRFTKKADREK